MYSTFYSILNLIYFPYHNNLVVFILFYLKVLHCPILSGLLFLTCIVTNISVGWEYKYLCQFFSPFLYQIGLLAHLSRRLTRWAYSIPMVRRPSVVRRRPHFQTWISLKPVGQSWSNFMCSITGMGERLHNVLGQTGLKLWFPWQQKAPIDL